VCRRAMLADQCHSALRFRSGCKRWRRRGRQFVIRRTSSFCVQWPVPVHSAQVGSVYRVCYRWHAYFGSEVKIYRSYRRGDGTYLGLERDPGIAIIAPAWVLDASICGMMTLGPPRVSVAGLVDLSAVLTSHGFRRSFGENDSSKEAEHDQSQNNQSGATAPSILSISDCVDGRTGTRDVEEGACAAAAGSGRRDTGGIN